MTSPQTSDVRNTDHFLPYGEMLRCFIDQPEIPASQLNSLLRQRGVFLAGREKTASVPVLVSSLIAVEEFDVLLNAYKSKENRPKIITRSVRWETKDTAIQCAPDGLLSQISKELEFANYGIAGNTDFAPVDGDPNHIRLGFKVERSDTSRNWCQSTSHFHGEIELRVVKEDGVAHLSITHTANETKDVASKAVNRLIQHFRLNGAIDTTADAAKILFSAFTNEERVKFFLGLLRDDGNSELKSIDIIDLAIAKDEDVQEELPEPISWLEEKIQRIRCKGQSLQDAAFIEDECCHRHIQIHAMEASYSFDIKGATGKCRVAFEFPRFDLAGGKRSELQLTLLDIKTGKAADAPPVSVLRSFIIRDLQSVALRRFAESKGIPV